MPIDLFAQPKDLFSGGLSLEELDPTGEKRRRIAEKMALRKAQEPTRTAQQLVDVTTESARDIARRGAQGLTFGFADEAEALQKSQQTGRPYEEELKKIRQENEIAKMQQGAAGTAFELGTSMLTPAAGAGWALKGATTLGKMGRGTLTSAAQAGLTGAGTAEEDRLKSAGLAAAIGAPLGAVIPGVGAAGSKLTKLVQESPIGGTLGSLLPYESTVGRTVRGLEDLLRRSTISGAPLRKAEMETLKKGRGLIEEIAPEKSYEELGGIAKTGAEKAKQEFDVKADEAYKKVRDIVGKEDELITAPSETFKKLEEAKRGGSPSQRKYLERLQKDLTENEQTVGSLRATKSEIGALFDKSQGALSDQQKKLVYEGLKADQYSGIKKAAGERGEEVEGALKEADKYYKENVGKIGKESTIGEILDVEKGSAVTHELVRGGFAGRGGNVEKLKDVLEKLPQKESDQLRGGLARAGLFPPGKDIKELTAGQIEDAFDKMSPEARDLLFGSKLKDISKAMDVFERMGEKKLVPSGTPSGLFDIGAISSLTGAGLGAVTSEGGAREKSLKTLGAAGAGLGGASALALALARPQYAAKVLGTMTPTAQKALMSLIPQVGKGVTGAKKQEKENKLAAEIARQKRQEEIQRIYGGF